MFNLLNTGLAASYTYGGREITLSWDALSAKVSAGDFTGLNIGDYKDITLTTGEAARVELSGFNTYINTGSNPLTVPHIIFTFRDCLKTKMQMNSTASNDGGYGSSALAKTINTTVYNTFPSDLKAAIKEVQRLDNNKGGFSWSSYKLWIPKETEVFGRINWSDGYDGGGIQLPIFAHSYRHIVKGLGIGASENGSRTEWWLASPHANGFCAVSATGAANINQSHELGGVAPAFVI